MHNNLKKPIYSALIFFSTLCILSIWYWAYSALSPVNTWDPLTKTIWNQMVDNIADLNTRVSTLASSGSLWTSNGSDISYTAWNVWIGTSAPEKSLHIKTTAWNAELDIQTATKDKWGIYHDDTTEDLRFWNLANVLTLQKNGKIWIWTASPWATFEVNWPHTSWKGLIYANWTNHWYFMANAPANWEAWISIKNNGWLWWHMYRPASSWDLRFFDEISAKDVLSIKAGWNIWIGTSSPTQKLSMEDNSSYTALNIYNSKWSAWWAAAIQFGLNDGAFVTPDAARIEWRVVANPNMALDFKTYHWSLKTDMTLYNWNLWIGTTDPSLKLHVLWNAKIQSTSSSQAYATFAWTTWTVGWFWTSANWWLASWISDGDIVARWQWASIHLATDAWVALTATTWGKVWIWTTSPWAKLSVYSTNDTIVKLEDNRTETSWDFLSKQAFYDYSWEAGYVWIRHNAYFASGPRAVVLWVSWNEIMRLTHAGKVWIGTTSPSYQLQLSTDSAAKPGTSSWTIASDSRLKTNISNFNDGLDIINQINPVWFNYNGKAWLPTDKKYVGIIAQDMQKIAPYTINSYKAKLNPQDVKETELLNFNESALNFVMINAIKEQQKQIQDLKKINESLSERLEKLETN